EIYDALVLKSLPSSRTYSSSITTIGMNEIAKLYTRDWYSSEQESKHLYFHREISIGL
ncbi:predicted protein, partial [Arabidopsis lyrata subsp. lyrata]